MAESKYRRTTIEMPEDIYKRIKSLAIERDMTLREIITEALLEKLEKEESFPGTSTGMMKTGSLSYLLVSAMEKMITREAAITLLVRKCEKYGCDPTYLSIEDVDDEFLSSLCQGMSYLTNKTEKECMDILRSGMEES